MLRDEDMALDAMQDVFVNLLQNQSRLKGTYPSGLLYRIATNICLNIIRANKAVIRPGDDLLSNIASLDDIENRTAARDILDRIFRTEKVSTGEIAVMYYVDRMTLKEVAEASGMSVYGVRKRLRDLKARVRSLEEIA